MLKRHTEIAGGGRKIPALSRAKPGFGLTPPPVKTIIPAINPGRVQIGLGGRVQIGGMADFGRMRNERNRW